MSKHSDSRGESKEDSKTNWKSESKSSKRTSDDLLRSVQEYFYGDDDLANTFEAFVQKHAHMVDLKAVEAQEYRLEYTEVYETYKKLFERKIERFIEDDLQSSVRDFYEALQHKSANEPESNEAVFGQILLAVTDFDIFMTMVSLLYIYVSVSASVFVCLSVS